MDKANPPMAWGVFKPVGHTVMAFQSDVDLQSAVRALKERKFENSAWVSYSPVEMRALVDSELQAASSIATFGYEIDLAKLHRALAERGCSFLVVHAPDKAQANVVAEIARTMKSVAAQHYGTFMVEELVEFLPPENPTV